MVLVVIDDGVVVDVDLNVAIIPGVGVVEDVAIEVALSENPSLPVTGFEGREDDGHGFFLSGAGGDFSCVSDCE